MNTCMKPALGLLTCVCFTLVWATPARAMLITIDPTVVLQGTTAGSATDKDGKPNKTADDHAKLYNGATKFSVDYTINTKDGAFDPTGSTVKFTTIYYTSSKKQTPSDFATLSIPIKSAVITKDGKVESFTFEGNDWYPNADSDGISNNGLTGSVDLKKKTATFTSSYKDNSNEDIYKYVFSGNVVPEPAVSMMAAIGLVLAGLAGLRRIAS